jgi:DNA-binding NtrC family response regulator
VIHIKLPALRSIPDDIVQMAKYFLAEQCNHLNRRMLEFSNEALHCVKTAQWPGNVRQLQNEMKRLAICARGPVIEFEELSDALRGERGAVALPVDDSGRPLDAAVAEYEKKFIIAALGEHGNNQVRTAEALGLSRQGLIKKMKRLGVSSSGGDADGGED